MSETDWSKYEDIVATRWSYYGPRFEKFAQGGWLSWNWAAFIGTLAWLRFRKLYALSWAYFFVSTPFLLALLFVAAASADPCERALAPASQWTLARLILVSLLALGWIVPPLLADRLYYNRVRKIVAASDPISGTGGIAGALALQFFVFLGAIVTVPSYGHYAYRAMVSEGVLLVQDAKSRVQRYENERRRLPGRIDEVVERTSGKYVDRLLLEADGTIRAVFGATARKLSGHSVSLVPVKRDGRIVDWACRSIDLPDACLPASCRRTGG